MKILFAAKGELTWHKNNGAELLGFDTVSCFAVMLREISKDAS